MSAVRPQTAPRRWAHAARIIALASVGNALEWFDLAVFGFFSGLIAAEFFPKDNSGLGLILTLLTFGFAFVVRPLGAAVIGAYADRTGRMKALSLSVWLMVAGTAIIAFAPTYRTVGVAAPILLLLARCLQGFSAGGEFGSATAFLAEQSPSRRGFFSSWQIASQGLTTLLAAGFGAVLTTALPQAALEAWGWRVPFLFGLLIGPVAAYMRRRVPEPDEFRDAPHSSTPLRDVAHSHKGRVAVAIGATVLATVGTYVILLMPTYAVRSLGLSASSAFAATLVAGLVQLVLSPVVGMVSDRIGRLPLMAVCAVLMLAAVAPLFQWLIRSPSPLTILAVEFVYATILAGYFAPLPALMCDLFPVQVRTTGLSISYNVATTLFGGFAPAAITGLIAVTGDKAAPAYAVLAAAALSLTALGWGRLVYRLR